MIIHPLWVRVTHWINAVAVVVMIGSGWEIYNASPLFALRVPEEHHARRLARRRAALAFRGDVAAWPSTASSMSCSGIVTGRFRRKLLPIRPGEVVADARRRCAGQLSHDDLAVYNAVQKLLYLGVILAGIVIVLSGLAIWKPVQLLVAHRAVRRLRGRALRAFLRHGGDRRLLRHPRRDGVRGAEERCAP